MKVNKIIIFCLILCFIFSVHAVVAIDADADKTDDTALATVEDVVNETNDLQLLAVSDTDVLSEGEGTFSDLQDLINNNNDRTIELNRNYTFNSGTDRELVNGIVISNNIIIKGNDFTINALSSARIFNITGGSVILEGINFVNGGGDAIDYGGSIHITSQGMTIQNCNFTGFSCTEDGGAIYTAEGSDNCKLYNLTFTNGFSGDDGGAINIQGNDAILYNITCINISGRSTNGSNTKGGAISLAGDRINMSKSKFDSCYVLSDNPSENTTSGAVFIRGDDITVTDTTFTNCSSPFNGGVMNIEGDSAMITHCIFTNSKASHDGGALYVAGNDVKICDSIFRDTSAGVDGGAIYITGTGANICNSTFDNSAADEGAALYISGERSKVYNSTFTNITATDDGGAIMLTGAYGLIYNGTFTNITAGSGTHHSQGGSINIAGDYGVVTKSAFDNSYSNTNGGAIYATGNHVNITDSTFISCHVSNANEQGYIHGGGAIFVEGNYSKISNCAFDDSSAKLGGVIYIHGHDVAIDGINSTNSIVPSSGGAIFIEGKNGRISNSKISVSKADVDGGAIYIDGNNTTISETILEDCNTTRDGGAIYVGGQDTTLSGVTSARTVAVTGRGGSIFIQGANTVINESNLMQSTSALSGGSIFIDGRNAKVIGTNITRTTSGGDGGAIYISEEYATITGCHFEMNNATLAGGAVYVSGGHANITYSTCNLANSFLKSATKAGGGAIFVEGSYSDVYYSNFTNCFAESDGGAIFFYGQSGSGLKYNKVIGCLFINNKVNTNSNKDTKGGGAIYWSQNGEYGAVRDSIFINNTVKGNMKVEGGAILWDLSSHGIIDNCIFDGNSINTTNFNQWSQGGAVFLRGNKNYTISNCEFKNNWGVTEAGAIYVSNKGKSSSPLPDVDILIVNVTFINNTAKGLGQGAPTGSNANGGGAVQLKEAKNVWFRNVTFINNTANLGGGFALGSGNNNNDNLHLVDCTFIGNRAIDVLGDGKYGSGGAIYIPGTYIKLDNITMIDNYADDMGGGLYAAYISSYSNLTFINNTAKSGGGLYWNQGSKTITDMVFINNTAINGGAIFLPAAGTTVSSINFTGNTAAYGGAIYVNNANIILNNNIYTNNSATVDGGAIYMPRKDSDASASITQSSFNGNHADGSGGAIFCGFKGNTNRYITDCNFTKNTAGLGGAIYIINANQKILSCNFDENNATGDGGAIHVTDVAINTYVQDSTFKNSHAANGGAIYNDAGSSIRNLWIVNDTFIKNIASYNGGAVLYRCDNFATNFRDYQNFDGRGIPVDGGRTDLYYYSSTQLIFHSYFEDNQDYILNLRTESDLDDSLLILYITNPDGSTINRRTIDVVVTLINITSGLPITNVTITSENFLEHYNQRLRQLYVNFGDLEVNETYNITVEFSDANYMKKSALTYNTTHGEKRGDFERLQILIDTCVSGSPDPDGVYRLVLKRAYEFNSLDKYCMNITDLKYPLIIDGADFSISADGKSRIFYISAANVTFVNVVFSNGNASGEFGDDPAIYGNRRDLGGAILWAGENGLLENTTFSNNFAVRGGAIYYNVSASNCKIVNTLFSSNNATTNGGAIDCNASKMRLEDTTFESNYAVYGAALCREINSTEGSGRNNIFRDNHAEIAGAALAWINATRISIDEYYFYDNTAGYSGGAIYVGEGSKNCEILNCLFDNNYVKNETNGHGGAIEWYSEKGIVYNTIFTNNHAYDGGAIYVGSESGEINILESTFRNNHALTTGGAISIVASAVTVNSSNFYDNNATRGGALFVGGNGTANYIYSSVFEGNKAIGELDSKGISLMNGLGGAIDWVASSGYIIDTRFTNNCADYGGGVYFGGKSNESVITNCKFIENKAKYNGGAIDCNASKMYLTNTLFDGNFAQFGAALCRETNAQSGSGENNTFKNNHAIVAGAALAWMGSVGIKITNYTFINNSVDVAGGTIYVSVGSDNCSVIDCQFENNYVTNLTNGWNSGEEFNWTAWDGSDMYYTIQWTTDPSLNTTADVGPTITIFYYTTQEELDAALGTGGAIAIFGANAKIINSSFAGGSARLGGGIYVGAYTGNTILNKTIFRSNTASERGGAVNLHASGVHIDEGQFYDNIAVNGSALYVGGEGTENKVHESIFQGNNATGYGGAIYWVAYVGEIYNSEFISNSAEYGGGIYFNGRSNNTDIINNTFRSNRAVKNGGAIECNASSIGIYNITFEDNYAGEYGAALCRESGATSGHGTNNTFKSNHAGISGAALAWMGVQNIRIYDYKFFDNTAERSGGAIYAAQGSDNCIIQDCIFEGNHLTNLSEKHYGGAIDCVADNMTINMSSFKNNEANGGGAIYVGSTSSRVRILASNFTGNHATGHGGAIGLKSQNLLINNTYFIANTADVHGGALCAEGNGTNNTIYYSSFENNTAGSHGGAINWLAPAADFKYINFIGNSAEYGGALYLNGVSSNSSLESIYFKGNRATKNGGAIDCNATRMGLNNTQFIENYAGEYGAALCREANATGGFGGNNIFIKNHAEIAGAALAWLGVDGININHYTFINNTADEYGGAIYVREDSPNCKVRNSYFENNYITDVRGGQGGAIDWLGTNAYIYNSTFIDSFAVDGGTIYFGLNSTNATILESRFEGSRALGEGGAIVLNGNDTLISKSNFSYCVSLEHGGVIAAHNAYNAKIVDCFFNKNVGAGYIDDSGIDYGEGGVIFWENGRNLNITNVLINHTESHSNGAISLRNCNDSVLYNVSFIGAITIRDGGCLSLIDLNNVTVDSCEFRNTAASYNGGSIFLNNVDDIIVKNSLFNNTSALYGNGGAIYINGNATFDNNTYETYSAYSDYAGGIFVYSGTSTISNSTFIGPDAIWVNATATAYIYKNNITGMNLNKNTTYLDKPYDARYNKYDYSVWNDGDLYLDQNDFGYIIFNNGTIWTPTTITIIGNTTHNETWNDTFVFWADIVDDNNNTIISVDTLDTWNDIYPEPHYKMPYNYLETRLIYQGKFIIHASDSGLKDSTVKTGQINVKLPITLTLEYDNLGEEDITFYGVLTVPVQSNYTIAGQKLKIRFGEDYFEATIYTPDAVWDEASQQWKWTVAYANFTEHHVPVGTYTVTGTYDGDDYHWDVYNETSLSFFSRPIWIAVHADDIFWGQTLIVNVTSNATNTVNGRILISINGKVMSVPLHLEPDGSFIYYLPNENYTAYLEPGMDQVVSVIFTNGTYWETQTNSSTFNVYQVTTEINATPIDIEYGENEIINVTVNENATGYIAITNIGVNGYLLYLVNGTVQFNISGLAPGVYENVTVVYSGDNHFLKNETNITFTVHPTDDFDMDVKVDNITYGQNATIRVLVATDAVGNVTIWVDGVNKGTVNLTKGVATLDVAGLAGGEHVVNVTYNGGPRYSPKDVNNTVFKVNPESNWKFTFRSTLRPYGENSTIFISTLPYHLSGNNVTVEIAGNIYVVNLTNGEGNLTLNNLSAGSYLASVTYDGDANYSKLTQKVSVNIIKATPTVTLTQNGTDVIATVSGNATGNITFHIHGESYTINLVEGNATLLNNLTPGSTIVVAEYNGDNNYTAATGWNTFVVDLFETFINATPVNITYGKDEIINVTVNETATGYIVITIAGQRYLLPLDHGAVQFNISGLAPGVYENITVIYSGDDDFARNTTYITFRVDPTDDFVMDVKVDNITYGQNATVRVLVPTDADGNVTIWVDGVKIDTVNITNGVATLDIAGLAGGDHVVNVTYNGDSKYTPKSLNNTVFKVNPESNWKFTFRSTLRPYGENSTIFISTLPYHLSGNNVTVEIAGNIYVVNLTNGEGNLTLNNLSAGSYLASVTYAGDANYSKLTQKVSVNIIKATPTVTLTQNGTDVIVTVSGNATGNITFNVKGNNYTMNLVNGQAVLLNNLTPGTTIVVAEYNGDKNYNNATGWNTFVVDLFDTFVNATPVNITYGKDEIINVTVNETATGYIVITIAGQRYLLPLDHGRVQFNISGLAPGVYENITVIYSGDDDFARNTTNITFRVDPTDDYPMDVQVDDIYYGDNATVRVAVATDAVGNVTIWIDGVEWDTVNLTDGLAVLENITGLAGGVHVVNVTYNGCSKYAPKEVNDKTFTVKPDNDWKMTITSDERPYGENTTIYITTLPYHVAGNNVTIVINNVSYVVDLIDGNATLTLNNLSAGGYTSYVEYAGDANYSYKKQTFRVNIVKATPTITLTQDGTDVIANVSGNVTGNVTFYINGRNYTVNLVEGIAILSNNLTIGNNSIVAIYNGDKNYTNAMAMKTFGVDKYTTFVNATPVNITYGKDEIINVTVNETATGYIMVTIAGQTYLLPLDVTGRVQFNITGLAPGVYENVPVIYSGDDEFDANTTYITFRVDPTKDYPIEVTVDDISYGDNATVRVTVATDAVGNVTIWIDGENKGTFNLTNGTATLIVPGLEGGEHVVNVTYNGGPRYAPKDENATATFNVNPTKNWKFDITTDEHPYGENTTIFVDGSKYGLLNDNVTIKIDNVSYVVPLVNGKGNLTLNNLSAGTHTGHVIYAGDRNYAENDQIFRPQITKATPTIIITQNGTDVIATVSGNATGTVTFYINGEEYENITVNGNATIKGKLVIGNNTVNVIYRGNENYTESDNATVIEIAKIITDMTVVAAPDNVVIGKPTTITVTMVNVTSGKVIIEVNGYNYTAEINSSGIAELVVALPGGSYTAKAYYLGDLQHEPCENVSNEFVVIDKITPEINITAPSVVRVGETVNITVTSNGYNLTVWINDEKQTIVNGNISYTVTSAGIKKIYAETTENETVRDANKTVIFEAVKTNATLIITEIGVVQVGDEITITVTNITDGELTIKLDGVEVTNGTTFTPALSGKYTITVESAETIKYYAGFNSTTFTVVKNNAVIDNITVPDVKVGVGKNATITVNMNNVTSGSVIIEVGGHNYTVAIVNKVATLNVTLPIGKYTAKAYYLGDDKYNATVSEESAEFTVADKEIVTIIIHAPESVEVDSNIVFTIENSTAVNVTVNGDKVEIKDGKYTYNATKAGIATIVVTSNETDELYPGYNSTTVVVLKHNSTVSIDPVANHFVGDEFDIVVHNNTAVVVVVNGKEYPVVDGKVSIDTKVLPAGEYIVTAYIKENDKYLENSSTIKFNITKRAGSINITVGEQYEIGTAFDIGVENNTEVTVAINGVKYNVTDGKVDIDTTKLAEGNYTVVATIYESDKYLGNVTVKSFIIFKHTAVIDSVVVPDADTYVGQNVTITVNMNNVTSGSVIIEVGNHNYTVAIEGKVATLTVLLPEGTYTAKAYYLGDDNYTSATLANASEFKVVAKQAAVIIIDADSIVEIENTLEFTVTNSTPVVVTINGKVYTPVNGKYVFEANEVGNYTIVARSNETDEYYAGFNTTTFKVIKHNATVDIIVGSQYEIGTAFDIGVENNTEVTVAINGVKYNVTDGKVDIDTTKLAEGNYTVVATIYESDKYLGNVTVKSFIIFKHTAVIDSVVVPDADTYVGQNVTITVNMNNVTSGSVIIEVGNHNYTVAIVDKVATLTVLLPEGTYKATAYYLGDDNYTSATLANATEFKVIDKQAAVIIIDADSIVEIDGTLEFTVTNSTPVVVTINGKVYTPVDGKYIFEAKELGNYTIVARSNETDDYYAGFNTTTFKVIKHNSFVNVTGDEIDVGETAVITIVAPNHHGTAIVNINGVNYSVAITDGNGQLKVTGLTKGTYDVNVTYIENDKYYSSINNTAKVVVSQKESEVNVEFTNITKGDVAIFNITVTPADATGNITVKVGDKTYTVGVVSGKAQLIVPDLAVGDYDITVTYNGDDKYESSSTTGKLNVAKVDSSSDVTVDDLGNGTVKVTVPEDATGNVTVTIGDHTYVADITNGTAYIDLTDETPGTYEAKVVYSGDGNYTNATVLKNVTIPKYATPMSIEVTDHKVGDVVEITVTVPENATGDVTIEINGVKYTKGISEGKAKFEIEGLKAGNKTVVATYDGNDNFVANSTTEQFTVSKNNAPISVSAEVNGLVTITVSDLPSDATGYVIISVNGTEYGINITKTKQIVISVPEAGKYNVIATYLGDDKYLGNVSETTFNADKASGVVAVDVNNTVAGNDVIVKVTVPDDATGNVTVTVGNVTKVVEVTGGENTISIPGVGEGTHNVTVVYSGDSKYNSTTVTKTIIIFKSVVVEEDTKRGWNSPYDYQAEFFDKDGNTLKNTEVQFIVDGKTYTIKTDNQGIAYLTDSHLDVGKHEIIVVNPATGERVNATTTIVKRLIDNKDITMDFADGTCYVVRAIGDDGNPVGEGEFVDMVLNNIHYCAKTDKDGYAKIQINLNPKTYTIAAEYKNTKVTNKLVVKQTFKLVKKTVKVKKGKKLVLQAKLKWSNGKSIKGKKIVFKFKGKKYNAKTNSKGIAKVTIKSKVAKKLKKGKKYAYEAQYLTNKLKGKVKVI